MAKFNCLCGIMIQTSGPIPNPVEWKLLSDTEFDQFEGLVDAESVYRASRSMFKCSNCGRLWVFWNGFDHDPIVYMREETDR